MSEELPPADDPLPPGILLAGYNPTPVVTTVSAWMIKCRWCLRRLPPRAFILRYHGGIRENKRICAECVKRRQAGIE
jgi:hypothetical protein